MGLKPSWKKPLRNAGLDGRLVKYEHRLRLKEHRSDRESNLFLFAVGIGIGIGIAIENGVDRVKADTDADSEM